MDSVTIGILGIFLMFFLISLGVPIGFSLGAVGFAGISVLLGFEKAFGILTTVPYSSVSNFLWIAVPLFVLMGNIAFCGGLVTDLYSAARAWLGWLPGGLSIASVAGCAAFASASGSSVATAATMGKVALPEMLRHEYDKKLSAGTLAAAGTLGSLIPPSIFMIIYGVITDTSIGKLFLAGFIPGVISAGIYMVMIFVRARFNPSLAPPSRGFTWPERISSLKGVLGIIIIVFSVLGGIYGGLCTPTEASAIGASSTLILVLLKRRLTLKAFWGSLHEAIQINCTLFVIVIGSWIFVSFLAISRMPAYLSSSIIAWDLSYFGLLIGVFLLYLFLGCIMEPIGMMLLTLPILLPTLNTFDIPLIWFGILMIKFSEIGMITPPVGLNVFIIKSVIGDTVSIEDIFRGIVPFLLMDVLTIGLLIAFPGLSLWLPSLM